MVLSSRTGKAIRKKKITLSLPPTGSAQSHKKSALVLSFPDYTHKVLAAAGRNYLSFGSCLGITSYGLSNHQISKQPKTETTIGSAIQVHFQ